MDGFRAETGSHLPAGSVLPAGTAAPYDRIETRGLLNPGGRVPGDRFDTLRPRDASRRGRIILLRVERQAEAGSSIRHWLAVGDTEFARGLPDPRAPPEVDEAGSNRAYRAWPTEPFDAAIPATAGAIMVPPDDAARPDDPPRT